MRTRVKWVVEVGYVEGSDVAGLSSYEGAVSAYSAAVLVMRSEPAAIRSICLRDVVGRVLMHEFSRHVVGAPRLLALPVAAAVVEATLPMSGVASLERGAL